MNTQPNRNVTLDQTTEVVCDNCGSNLFVPAAFYRKVSKIITGNAQDGYIPIEVPHCATCGKVNDEFVPPELRKPKLTI